LFSLFMVMTLEGWGDVARAVMSVYPAAWLFFVVFILISTFTVLNLFVALIVKVMEEPPPQAAPTSEIEALRTEVAALRRAVLKRSSRAGGGRNARRLRGSRFVPTSLHQLP
jgi:voltage-gated sodium channel